MKGAEINQNDLAIAEGRSFRPCPHLRSPPIRWG
jgi:hypothetical protein